VWFELLEMGVVHKLSFELYSLRWSSETSHDQEESCTSRLCWLFPGKMVSQFFGMDISCGLEKRTISL